MNSSNKKIKPKTIKDYIATIIVVIIVLFFIYYDPTEILNNHVFDNKADTSSHVDDIKDIEKKVLFSNLENDSKQNIIDSDTDIALKDLNIKNMILISRSRKKIIGLDGFGLRIKKQIIIK